MELFKILGTIAIDNGKANEAIGATGEHANKMASTMGTAFNKVGKFAVAAGKVIAQGLAVSSVAMGKLISSAVESYAEYEQLVGGVETLFKDSSGKVMQYAQEAYKTAGLSANEYMETVTSFSASLLQSMGGDTAKSAEIADMAIRDMSDNANKMGTDMGAIQNAYQGFAKQNYTMLDNLKLGYGGTQSEMKRLLKDAQKLTGVKYDINNLADVYSAIHAIQEEMGITGTTAAEAEQTISGSLASMKASWQNLLNGIAGAGDLSALTTNFVKSSKTFIGNIKKIMPNLVKGVNGLIQGLIPEIPGMLESILPGLLEGAASLLGGLVASLPDLIGIIIRALPSTMNTLMNAFEPILGKTLTGILRGAGNVVVGVIGSVHKLITGEVESVDSSLSTSTGRWVNSMEVARKECADLLKEEEQRKKLADGYLETLSALESKEIKTDDDLWAMQEATAALCNIYPELKAHVDEETGLFNENSDAIRDNITELNNLALAKIREKYTNDFMKGIEQNTELKLKSKAEEEESAKQMEHFAKQAEEVRQIKDELVRVGEDGKLSVLTSNLIKGHEGLEEFFNFDIDGSATVKAGKYLSVLNDLNSALETYTKDYEWWLNSRDTEQGKQGVLDDEMLRQGEAFLSMLQSIADEEGGFTKDSASAFAGVAESLTQYGELSQSAKEAWAEALVVMGKAPDEAATIAGLNKVAEEAKKTEEAEIETAEVAKSMFSVTPSTAGIETATAAVIKSLDGVISKAGEATSALRMVFGGGGGGGYGFDTVASVFGDGNGLPGHKTGLDFVPRDNYLARLHQGEAVLTADEARAWRNGQYGRSEEYHDETIISGNTFVIRQESDVYNLAVQIANMKRDKRRGRGAKG